MSILSIVPTVVFNRITYYSKMTVSERGLDRKMIRGKGLDSDLENFLQFVTS